MAHAEQDLMDRLRRAGSMDVLTIDSNAAEVVTQHERRHEASRAREVYFGLLDARADESMLATSHNFLSTQLQLASQGSCDLPSDMDELLVWMQSNTAHVGAQYQAYLTERRTGARRRYFPTKSHALHFLKCVAPTKLVDGAWLYGVVGHWRDAQFTDLVRIYLEELGEGVPERNHVLIYKKLLEKHECGQWEQLGEPYFVQGALQLALGQHACSFLPEVIGFNLGYEQLPLHLLICAHELDELGIDPHYFTLHVTIDNAASGHAARAVRAVFDALPRLGDRQAFYRRVRNGYQLSSHGTGTNEVIAQFDLQTELLAILRSKAQFGAQLHSDYSRIGGKTVNEWLSAPSQLQGFLDALIGAGWINRHQQPENSRFWRLIEGNTSPMFGVFTVYERQVIQDWIAGDSIAVRSDPKNSFRVRQRITGLTMDTGLTGRDDRPDNDFNSESRLLHDKVAAMPDAAAMDWLVKLMSPVHHHTSVGLTATRMFNRRLRA